MEFPQQNVSGSKWDDAEEVWLALLESRLKLIGLMREEAATHCARFTSALEEELSMAKANSPLRVSHGDQRVPGEGGRPRRKPRLLRRSSLSCLPAQNILDFQERFADAGGYHRWYTTK